MARPEPEITARVAGPADARLLRRFRCDRGGWFARDVQRFVRGPLASALASGERVIVLLFELNGDVAAIAAFEIDDAAPTTCDLHVVAVASDHQGRRVETGSGSQPLIKVVLDTALSSARDHGARYTRAIVARDNARSLRMLALEGFTRVGAFDKDYDEYAARIA